MIVEKRLNDFEKFRLGMVASIDRNMRAVESLQSILMKYLKHGKSKVEGHLTTTDPVGEVEVPVCDPHALLDTDPILDSFGEQYSLKGDGKDNIEEVKQADGKDNVEEVKQATSKDNVEEHSLKSLKNQDNGKGVAIQRISTTEKMGMAKQRNRMTEQRTKMTEFEIVV